MTDSVQATTDWRYELKLVCDGRLLSQARSWIRLHPAGLRVAYPPRRVNNLYLDTRGLVNYTANVAGLSQREKVRLRWYGDEMTVICPILERKQKLNMLGRKVQFALSDDMDLSWPWPRCLEALRVQVPPEWKQVLLTVQQPALLNHYQREYYVTPDGVVRVTLDFAQAAYDQRFSSRVNATRRSSLADTIVIEVKTARDQVDLLADVVSHFPVARSRNSKYANGVLAVLS